MTSRLRKKVYAGLFSALIAGFGLAGCDTLEGAGEDVEDAGDEVEEQTED